MFNYKLNKYCIFFTDEFSIIQMSDMEKLKNISQLIS